MDRGLALSPLLSDGCWDVCVDQNRKGRDTFILVGPNLAVRNPGL